MDIILGTILSSDSWEWAPWHNQIYISQIPFKGWSHVIHSGFGFDYCGITEEQYGVLLCPVILSRLPLDMRLQWACGSENHEGDLEWPLEFLQNEISRREWSQSVIKQESRSAVSGNEIKGGPRQATTAALPSLSSVPESCALCSRRGHTVNKCFDLTKVPVS